MDKVISLYSRDETDYMVLVIGAAPHDYPFYGNCEEQMRKWIKAKGFDGNIDEFCRAVLKGEIRV